MKHSVLGICLLVVGCGPIKFKKEDAIKTPSTPNQSEVAAAEEVKFLSIIESKQPNLFKVEIAKSESALYIRKIAQTENGPVEYYLDFEGDKSFIDSEVIPGKKYTYSRGGLDSKGEFQVQDTDEIEIPLDWVILNSNDLETFAGLEQQENGRIFFTHNIFVTHRKDIRLIAREIHFDKSIIYTLTEPMKADDGVKGKDGGKITIHAKKLIGEVKFHLWGQHGGDGIKPLPRSDRPAAVTEKGQPGRGSSCGREGDCVCQSGPTAIPGLKGFKGHPARKGLDGGNTGSLRITTEDSSEFIYEIDQRPGKAGNNSDPGRGGPGGLGGPYGDKGHPDCRDRSGERGPNGPEGDPGDLNPEKAKDGKKETVCLKISADRAEECK